MSCTRPVEGSNSRTPRCHAKKPNRSLHQLCARHEEPFRRGSRSIVWNPINPAICRHAFKLLPRACPHDCHNQPQTSRTTLESLLRATKGNIPGNPAEHLSRLIYISYQNPFNRGKFETSLDSRPLGCVRCFLPVGATTAAW